MVSTASVAKLTSQWDNYKFTRVFGKTLVSEDNPPSFLVRNVFYRLGF
jgi:hypothetical protein